MTGTERSADYYGITSPKIAEYSSKKILKI